MPPITTPVALAACLSLATACGHHDDSARSPATPTTIRVTGIPDENPTELARSYQPLVDRLSQRLGARVTYVPVTDYGAAVQALVSGTTDFAWLGGFTHVQARTMADVVPIVMRDIDREFHSVFIADTGAGIHGVADMRGHTFAFGSKSSTSGHLMPRHFLLETFHIDPDHDFAGAPVFSGAHDATVKLVESGKVAAGALNEQVWKRMVAEGTVDRSKVTQVWTTPPYVDYVWTARAAVPKQTRVAFADALRELDDSRPADRAILERMGAHRYVSASPHDFDAIEAVARRIGLLRD